MDQKLRLPTEGRRLQQLPPDPGCGRASCDVEVKPFPPLVTDDEEDVQGPIGHCLNHEEVGRPDAAELIG